MDKLHPESYLVHMMDDSLMSSDQMRAVQCPTVRKFFGKKGFLCRAWTGPKCPSYMQTIFSAGVLAFLFPETITPCSVPTMNLVGCRVTEDISSETSS